MTNCVWFPNLKSVARWQKVDLGHLYTVVKLENIRDTVAQERLVNLATNKPTFTHSYGGFQEDRTVLWDGFEKDAKRMIHLGVDFNNLDAGEAVIVPFDVELIHYYRDNTLFNGWGGRLIFKILDSQHEKYPYILLGHLDPNSIIAKRIFKAGEMVGVVGDWHNNGGWFRHLHVQQMSSMFVDLYKHDLKLLDGYAFDALNPEHVCDPTPLSFY